MIREMLAHLSSATVAAVTKLPRGAHRNKNSGHGYERDVRDIFREINWPFLSTARKESRSRDNDQIDLVNENEDQNGRFPYNVQCKSMAQIVNYHEILTGAFKKKKIKKGPQKGQIVKAWVAGMPRVPGIINVVLHKYTEPEAIPQADNSEKIVFIAKGYYATLLQDDWYLIVKERVELEQLRQQVKDLQAEIKRLKNDSTI